MNPINLSKALLQFFDIKTLGGHREFAKTHGTSRACPGVYCNAGLRRWFPRDGVTFDVFRQQGVTTDWLRATGDAMAIRLAEYVEQSGIQAIQGANE